MRTITRQELYDIASSAYPDGATIGGDAAPGDPVAWVTEMVIDECLVDNDTPIRSIISKLEDVMADLEKIRDGFVEYRRGSIRGS